MRLAANIAKSELAADRLEVASLFEDHASFVRTLACQLVGSGPEADDVVQEVFIVAWRKWASFDGSSVRGWLTRITTKVAAAARRRTWWRCTLGLESAREVPQASPPPPDRDLEVREARAIFEAVASGMSVRKRTVLVLADIHGLSGHEIAEIVGCPVKTVYTRLFHARREFVARFTAAGFDASHLQKGTLR